MVVSSHKKGIIDHPTYNLLKEISIDVPIVPLNNFSNYEFNEELYNLDKWVLADFLEMGANDWDRKETLIFGENSQDFKKANTEEWQKFDKFVQDNPPIAYFKRELLKKDVHDNIYPIDFPCFLEPQPLQLREDFNARPIDVFHFWGHSHEARRSLQGNIFLNSTKSGYGVIDNFYHIERGIKEYSKVWVTVQVPHYARIPMEQIVFINGNSKLSVSLPGAGAKCFRMSESSLNSVMVMQDDKMSYAYEWIDGVNCIKIPLSDDHEEIRGIKNQWVAIEILEKALQRNDLYDIYLRGAENCEKYMVKNYCKNYIEPIIKKHL